MPPGGGNGIPPGIPPGKFGIGGPLPAGEAEGGNGGKGGMPRPPGGGRKGGGAPEPPGGMLKGGGGMPAAWWVSGGCGTFVGWGGYRGIRRGVGGSLVRAWVEDRRGGLAWGWSLLGLRRRRRR